MHALALLSILSLGYLIFVYHPYFYLKIHRYGGQQLYLKCAVFGLFSLVTSSFVVLTSYLYIDHENIFVRYINTIFIKLSIDDIENKLLILSMIGSYFVGLIWVRGYIEFMYWKLGLSIKKSTNPQTSVAIISRKDKAQMLKSLITRDIFSDSPLDSLLLEAYDNRKVVMLHMDDRKVYIGNIMSMGEPSENKGVDQEIKLFPLLSGYRDLETHKVNIITTYQSSHGITLVLRQDKIISATLFNVKAWLEYSATTEVEN